MRTTRNLPFAEYQETFNLFDNRGDGKIFVHQLGEALRAMGQNPTEADVRKCAAGQDPGETSSLDKSVLSGISADRQAQQT